MNFEQYSLQQYWQPVEQHSNVIVLIVTTIDTIYPDLSW